MDGVRRLRASLKMLGTWHLTPCALPRLPARQLGAQAARKVAFWVRSGALVRNVRTAQASNVFRVLQKVNTPAGEGWKTCESSAKHHFG